LVSLAIRKMAPWLIISGFGLDLLTPSLYNLSQSQSIYRGLAPFSFSLIQRPTIESESYITTDGQSVCLGIKHPSRAYNQIFITVRACWCGARSLSLSDGRTDLSFTIAAGPRQRSHFRVRVSWDSWPYFTVSDSKLPFSSPPTTRRVTVEVFDPAFTQSF
jgi:hypothetical protein